MKLFIFTILLLNVVLGLPSPQEETTTRALTKAERKAAKREQNAENQDVAATETEDVTSSAIIEEATTQKLTKAERKEAVRLAAQAEAAETVAEEVQEMVAEEIQEQIQALEETTAAAQVEETTRKLTKAERKELAKQQAQQATSAIENETTEAPVVIVEVEETTRELTKSERKELKRQEAEAKQAAIDAIIEEAKQNTNPEFLVVGEETDKATLAEVPEQTASQVAGSNKKNKDKSGNKSDKVAAVVSAAVNGNKPQFSTKWTKKIAEKIENPTPVRIRRFCTKTFKCFQYPNPSMKLTACKAKFDSCLANGAALYEQKMLLKAKKMCLNRTKDNEGRRIMCALYNYYSDEEDVEFLPKLPQSEIDTLQQKKEEKRANRQRKRNQN